MSDLYGLVFQKVLYPGWETGMRRRPTLSHLERLERSEWCSLDELRALQSTELRKLLDHAYKHSPHYRRKFEERGLRPGDIIIEVNDKKTENLSTTEVADLLKARGER